MPNADQTLLRDRIYGCLNGGLIGDAMGAPAEGKHYDWIREHLGEITDFTGVGTDDTAIKHILVDAILSEAANGGHITADQFARSFLGYGARYQRLFWIPVQNMFQKIRTGTALPVDAGVGNLQSSSSAMAIAPMGIVNACDPRRAVQETFDVAGLIHSGQTGFSRDAACAMAAGVAAAFRPQATSATVIDEACRYLHPVSAAEFATAFRQVVGLAESTGSYELFRARFYEEFLRELMPDPRETVPVTFALVHLSRGDFATGVKMAANFGRDADTIACMVGSLLGALGGAKAIPPAWLTKVEATAGVDYQAMTTALVAVLVERLSKQHQWMAEMQTLLS
jgi:ADP-ribosylglycohydrolase